MDLQDLNDRLEGLGSEESFDFDNPNADIRKNKALNNFLMQGSRAPRNFDTLSEIDDPKVKEKIFDHTTNKGLFRNIN